ncbi:MAG: UDP-N-acetylglucosamine 4,6-dehydratase (inverting), partial [Candidatus Omnitrophica bacterium]|nr:UDP-N-acetylglucosamine 4,6-dehydratase (inverting) [Candidatus Omnitrophota bacterium]
KMHEILVSEDESSRTKIFDGIYVILPQFFEKREAHRKYKRYRSLPANFAYKSDDNKDWLTIKELQNILKACTNI